MDIRKAKKEVLAFLQSEVDKREEPGKFTPHIELWPRSNALVGVRVAEVDFTFGEPGQAGSGGGSLMQVDVPYGLVACAAAERLVLGLCLYPNDTEELEDDKWRLVKAIWGKEN